jgi:hypothetical protein
MYVANGTSELTVSEPEWSGTSTPSWPLPPDDGLSMHVEVS